MRIQEINQLSPEQVVSEMLHATHGCKNYFTFRHRLASGEVRDVEVYSNTVEIKGHRYLLSFIHDVTDGRRAEAALRESEARHREMFANAPFAISRALPDGTFLDVNPRFAQLFGYASPEEFLATGLMAAQLFADPARRADLWEMFQHSREHIKIESRYRRRDGSEFTGGLNAQIIRKASGEVVYIESFIEDITERKQIEQELQIERDFALAVMNTMGQGLTVTNAHGCFEYINPAYAQFMGYHPEDLIGKRPEDLTSDMAQSDLQSALEQRRSGLASTYESRLINADGTPIEVLITGTPRRRDGRYAGSIAVITDLTERKRIEAELRLANAQLLIQMDALRDLQAQLREQAIRDPLTNLYNRRYLDETLPREVARAQRLGHHLAMLMIDIDHFKQINDTYGHAAGDETLQAITTLIRTCLRASDIACRYGGEEILCVLVDTSLENATAIADELRCAIAAMPIIVAHPEIRISVSIGVAVWPHSGHDSAAVLRAADMALYHAKRSGRNRVHATLSDDNG
jgi:diguanylate cyclase (GGDEF)-like protein/PAS domain S-box-containing protein